MNPIFDNEKKYDEFRAILKIWIGSLLTLDGSDFKENQATIKAKQKEVEALKQKLLASSKSEPLSKITKVKYGYLGTIPEEYQKNATKMIKKDVDEDLLKDLQKKGKGTF